MRPEYTRIESGFMDCRVWRDLGDDWQAHCVRMWLTCGPGTSMSGVQRMGESTMRIALAEMPASDLRRCLARLEEVGFIVRDGDWMWVVDKAQVNVIPATDGQPRAELKRMWAEIALCSSGRIVRAVVERYGQTHRMHQAAPATLVALRLVCPEAFMAQPMQRTDAHHARTPTDAHPHTSTGDASTDVRPYDASRGAQADATRGHASGAGQSRAEQSRAAHAHTREGRPDSASPGVSDNGRPNGAPHKAESVRAGRTTAPDANAAAALAAPDWRPGDEVPGERMVQVDGVTYRERFVGGTVDEWRETVAYRRKRGGGRLGSADVAAVGYGGAAWVRFTVPANRVDSVLRVYCDPTPGVSPSWEHEARVAAWAEHPDNGDRVTAEPATIDVASARG